MICRFDSRENDISKLRVRSDDSKAAAAAGCRLREPPNTGLSTANSSTADPEARHLTRALVQCDDYLAQVQDENQRLHADIAHLEAQVLAKANTALPEPVDPPAAHLTQALDSCGEYLMDAKQENSRLLASNNSLHELVRERGQEIEKAKHAANHDELTGLCNRRTLPRHLRNAFSHARQHGECVAVVMLDLDGFKRVNDRLGHAAGDQLLEELARRIALGIRGMDTVCRYGGDEFVLILPDMSRSEARDIVEKLGHQVAEPFALEGQSVSLTLSAGIAMYPDDGKDAKQLLEAADTAMYRDKPRRKRIPKIRQPQMAHSGSNQ